MRLRIGVLFLALLLGIAFTQITGCKTKRYACEIESAPAAESCVRIDAPYMAPPMPAMKACRMVVPPPTAPNSEAYKEIVENAFHNALQEPLSTFSIDVDTASYSNMRRFLEQGILPPSDAVRIEELVNYFDYAYPGPSDEKPFAVNAEIATCPWKPEHRLLRIGLKGREIKEETRPAGNYVFLIDVSGSMSDANKLPLLVRGMKLLVNRMRPEDRIAVVVYAGASGVALPSTTCTPSHRHEIEKALDNLQAGGSTAGSAGLQLAYEVADEQFIKGGVNRVILATDGDFNVGTTNQDDLVKLIEEKAKSGVFLTVLGFGMGNYKDSTLEMLADKGNGNYGYIDNISEARRMLLEKLDATLVTIAKDVKIQIEFNPAQVAGYRLIGYENRLLNKEDFNDDTKDAGEIGAGHTVTALYELVPAGGRIPSMDVDPLKYQVAKNGSSTPKLSDAAGSGEAATIKLRYKKPEGDSSELLAFPVIDRGNSLNNTSEDFCFAASVAAFGMLLRDSPNKGAATCALVLSLAQSAKGEDEYGYRAEFLSLVRTAQELLKK